MYILSDNHRSEFLANGSLARIVLSEDRTPLILVQANSLNLKCIIKDENLDFIAVVSKIYNICIYGVRVYDDPTNPIFLWSAIESEEELHAVKEILQTKTGRIHLFNELAVDQCQTDVNFTDKDGSVDISKELFLSHHINYENLYDNVHEILCNIETSTDKFQTLKPEHVLKWKMHTAIYLPTRTENGASELSFNEQNEGDQQEELILWLIDELCPEGAIKNPVVHTLTKSRELTDLMMIHKNGYFLFESKTLSILSKEELDKIKLKSVTFKHVKKAIKQLGGASRYLNQGLKVTDSSGKIVEIEKGLSGHVIILIPDLSLIDGFPDTPQILTKDFHDKTNCLIQILDPQALLRLVQGAEMIANRHQEITRLMALDHLLIERMKVTLNQDSFNFDFLIRESK